MAFKGGCFFVMLVAGSLAFPLNEEQDMSFFFDNTIDPFIVGGIVAVERVPHMVALTTGVITKSFFCGGSIINNRFILTANHCIRNVQSGGSLLNSLRGNVGSNVWAASPVDFRFSRAINHPDYNNDLVHNDIGFFVTVSAIGFTNNIQPIVLNFDFIDGDVPVIANGWGRLVTGGTPSQNLMELRPLTVNGERCISEVARVAAPLNIRVPPVTPELQLCAFFENNTGMCHGDSGSALILEENKQQVGIVSWGVPCAQGAPDMYARISAYKSWIEQQLQSTI